MSVWCVKDRAAQLREGGREIDTASTRIVDEYTQSAGTVATATENEGRTLRSTEKEGWWEGGKPRGKTWAKVRACVRANGGCEEWWQMNSRGGVRVFVEMCRGTTWESGVW